MILFYYAWIQWQIIYFALSDSWAERAIADLGDLVYELRRDWLRLNQRQRFGLFALLHF